LNIKIDFLFIDGLSGCNEGRFMIFYSLRNFLNKFFNVTLHDSLRDKELGIIKSWLALKRLKQVLIELVDRGLMKAEFNPSVNISKYSEKSCDFIFEDNEKNIIEKIYDDRISNLISLPITNDSDCFVQSPCIVEASTIASEVLWEKEYLSPSCYC